VQTDRLILELSKQAKPVKRLPPVYQRCLCWLASALLCLGVGVALMGLRSDFAEKWMEFSFALQAALTLLVASLSAIGAFTLSVPSENKSALTRVAPLVALVCWLIYLLVSLITSSRAKLSTGSGLVCAQDILILALPPAAMLFIMIHRAAPLMIKWTDVLISLSVAAFGALGTQLICRNDDLLHMMLWHVIPVLMIGALGAVLGQPLLRWERR
jgi:hypothetical protein